MEVTATVMPVKSAAVLAFVLVLFSVGAVAQQSVTILEPAEGATIWGNVINARWMSEGVDIQSANGEHAEGVGHYHAFLFKRSNAELNLKAGVPIGSKDNIVHTTDDNHLFENVLPGVYTLYVVLADGQHVPDDPVVFDVVHFTVVPTDQGSTVANTPWWLIALILGAIVAAALLLRLQ